MGSGGMVQILGIVLIFVVLYMLMIRPQRKKEKAINEMRNALKAGDMITTIGGIKAKVVTVKDETLIIQVGADKVKFEVTRWAVSRVDNQAEATKGSATKATSEEDNKEEATEKPASTKPKRLAPLKAEDKDSSEEGTEDKSDE